MDGKKGQCVKKDNGIKVIECIGKKGASSIYEGAEENKARPEHYVPADPVLRPV
jgi:hypothetical protein